MTTALLAAIRDWCDGYADGAPDAPGWHKDAGWFQEKCKDALTRPATSAIPERVIQEFHDWAIENEDHKPVAAILETIEGQYCARCREPWAWDGDSEDTKVCASCLAGRGDYL